MNFNINTLAIISGFALSLAAAPSLAQVAPPPTSPAEKEPEYKPDIKPKAAPKPTQARPKPGVTNQKAYKNTEPSLPDIPYARLANRGPDGRVIRLGQLPDIAALKSNPTVGPKTIDLMMPYVFARRNRLELRVIDNLDLYWELAGPRINNLDMSNLQELGAITKMLKPLVLRPGFTQEMINHDILSRIQGGMNKKIIGEYTTAITDEIKVLDDDEIGGLMRYMLQDSLFEAKLTYYDMLAELMENASKVVQKSGLTSSDVKALVAFEKSVDISSPNKRVAQIHEFDIAFHKLTYAEGIKLLTTMRENRADPTISPAIQKINVLHPGKSAPDVDLSVEMKDKEQLLREHEEERKKKKALKDS